LRLTVSVSGSRGTLAKITQAISDIGGDIVGIGVSELPDADPDCCEMMLKVQDVKEKALVQAVQPIVNEVIDVREIKEAA
jgi:acetoin utilization protein AcuB